MLFSSVIDLSLVFQARDAALCYFSGLHHVLWQTHHFPTVRPSPIALFPAVCPTISRKSQAQDIPLSRPVPLYGFWPTGLSGKPTRHRSLPPSTKFETLSYGHTGRSFTQHTLQRQQGARLPHIRRFRPIPDSSSRPLYAEEDLALEDQITGGEI